jgi:septum formation protein
VNRPVVLASSSPRRRELLTLLGVAFDVVAPDLDETPLPGETPLELVIRLAAAKASAVADRCPGAVVIGADTAVDVAGEIYGKPIDPTDASRMLRALSGRTHVVHTGVAVAADGETSTANTSSEVAFASLTDEDIQWYLGTGEPFDKAGAYALQGAGGVFVQWVRGSVSGVLGLPLHETSGLLRDLD